jgi:hypothetical protein
MSNEHRLAINEQTTNEEIMSYLDGHCENHKTTDEWITEVLRTTVKPSTLVFICDSKGTLQAVKRKSVTNRDYTPTDSPGRQ